MRTLFLIGILVALVVIATKKDDQTAIEAALEMGHKAQNIVAEFDKAEIPIAEPKYIKKPTITPIKDDNPFIKNTMEALKSYKPKSVTPLEQTNSIVTTKNAPSLSYQKRDDKKVGIAEKSAWSLAKPEKAGYPEMPAIPKAVVQEVSLDGTSSIEIANAQAATVDVGKSYDLVKGYYENASRLLEEIK